MLQEYFWHPIEERILEKRTYLTNGALKERILYINENYLVIENQSGRFNETYIYQDGTLVAQIDTNGNKQAMHSDHEGSSSLITDTNGDLVEITFYSPFGEILEGGKTSRFDYEGKEFDSAVQDYDFHFRKYNPAVPIFNQPDTLLPNRYDPQYLNRYMFERGNPQKNVDPTGHCPWCIAGALIGGAYNTVQYYATHESPTLGGAATYFATGAAQGALVASGTGVIATLAVAGAAVGAEAIERGIDGEKVNDNYFNYLSEGVLAAGAFKLTNLFSPDLKQLKNVKSLSSVFTSKSGQQFVVNQLTENVATSAGQSAYYLNNPNMNNQVDEGDKSIQTTSSSRNGGGSRNTVSQADKNKASQSIASLQKSGFITVSSGFAKLASSRGIKVSTSNNRR